MSKFLNTKGISDWITRIIDDTERELIIITPYMKISVLHFFLGENQRITKTKNPLKY